MTIRFTCRCGQQLNARAEYAGRSVICGACGLSNVVPVADAVTASPTHKAPARLPWAFVVVLGVFLLLFSIGMGGWLIWRSLGGVSSDNDLDYIPADGSAFLSFRVADTWDKPVGKELQAQLLQQQPNFRAEFEQGTGLLPEHIERFTMVWTTRESDLGWGILLTREPYNKDKVLQAFCPDGRTVAHAGAQYRVDSTRNVAVHTAGKRILIVGNERGVKRCLELVGKMARVGPLKDGIERLQDPEYQLVGAVGPKPPTGDVQEAKLLEMGLQGGTLTGKMSADVTLHGQANFSSEKEARQAQTQLQLLKLLAGGLPQEVKPLLQQGEFKAEGAQLSLNVKLDAQQAVALLMYLTRLAGDSGAVTPLPAPR